MNAKQTIRVTVLDMQPIDPPVGGGRLRLLGLYHALGEALPTQYVGTYDWQGQAFRRHQLSPTLEEIDVPLSKAHFSAHEGWQARVQGRTLIDTTFGLLGGLSSDYVRQASEAAAAAEVVIFSHPWVYPLLRDRLRDEQLLVYDAHNFEGLLRAELWGFGGPGAEVAKHVVAVESELARRADLILSCSDEDSRYFVEIYGVLREALLDVPNGVFTEKLRPPTRQQKESARAALQLGAAPAAMFIGSSYKPNVEAVEHIVRLAPSVPEVRFLVCGGVCDAVDLSGGRAPPNVRAVGRLSEEQKQQCLWAADIGLNPMSSGSGTNIKMFDYMAAGLPVVSTPVGARGIAGGEREGLWVADGRALAPVLKALANDASLRERGGAAARGLVCEKYSWERISPRLGATLRERWQRKRTFPRPVRPPWSSPRDVAEGSPLARARGRRSRPGRVALLTTWQTRCGIAEYSSYLTQALAARGVECLVVNGSRGIVASASDSGGPSVRAADLQTLGRGDGSEIVAACHAGRVNRVLVQHHPEFFDDQALLRIVRACRDGAIEVVLTCHNTQTMAVEPLVRASEAGAQLVVHNQQEVLRLEACGVQRVVYVPHGILDAADEDRAAARKRLRWDSGPVIGTFGFLRPHKGVTELIEAYAIVRELHPGAKLLALTALYDSDDSRAYLARCTELLAQRGLDRDGRIVLDTQFREIDDVLRRLHACDVIVLPYHASGEGGSGAAATALAARRPVITTRAKVFRDTLEFTYALDSLHPFAVALGICTLLSSPDLQKTFVQQGGRFINDRSWSVVAEMYERLLFGATASAARNVGALAGPREVARASSARVVRR